MNPPIVGARTVLPTKVANANSVVYGLLPICTKDRSPVLDDVKDQSQHAQERTEKPDQVSAVWERREGKYSTEHRNEQADKSNLHAGFLINF
jgi:hypothetical protein